MGPAWQLLRHVGARQLLLRRAQTLRAFGAVMICVGAVVAVDVVDATLSRGMEESLAAAAGRADVRVHGGEPGLDEALLATVRALPGVDTAVPLLEAQAYLADDAGEGLTVFGVDVTEEGRVRRYASATGEQDVVDDALVFLSRPDSVIVTDTFAARHGLVRDARLELQLPVGRRTLVVRGVMAPKGAALAFAGNLAVMDYQAAQMAFARPGRLDAIDVVAAPGAEVGTLVERLRAAVGPDVQVEPARSQGDDVASATRGVRRMFWLFSTLTVVVAMFLLYNAVSMTVAQRGRELAILRALGVRRAEVVRMVLAAAAVVGTVGGLAGIAFGAALAHLLQQPLTDTLRLALFLEVGRWRPVLPGPSTIALAILLGVGTSLVAAWRPARQAARFPPAVAARRDAVVVLRQGRLPGAGWGVAGCALGTICVWLATRFGIGMLGPVADVAFLFGAGVLLPTALRRAVRAIAPRCPRAGPIARLAMLNLERCVDRSALAAGALMAAVAFAVSIAACLESFRVSLGEWIDGFAPFDLQIASVSEDLGRNLPLPEAFGDDLAGVPGVARVRRFRLAHLRLGERRIAVESHDFDPADPARGGLRVRRGDAVTAFRALAQGTAVAVSENLADKLHVAPGATLTLPTARGAVTLPVAAVVLDLNSDQGTVLMARRRYVELFADRRVDQFLVTVAPGSEREGVRREILRRYGPSRQLVAITMAELRDDVAERVRAAFMPATALLLLTVLIGCLGIANAMAVAVAERVRELGVLRSVGFLRRQVGRLVLAEATVLGVIGATGGLALGTVLSFVWVVVHIRHILGWVIDYHFAAGDTAVILVAALLSAPLAVWRAAQTAATLPPAAALAEE